MFSLFGDALSNSGYRALNNRVPVRNKLGRKQSWPN
jgi:hypothetical protein